MWVSLLIALLLATAEATAGAAAAPEFVGVQVFAIDGSAGKDLSGLAFCKGRLLTNSDKVDQQIYAIELPGTPLHTENSPANRPPLGNALLVPAQKVTPLPSRNMHYGYPALLPLPGHCPLLPSLHYFVGNFPMLHQIHTDTIYHA